MRLIDADALKAYIDAQKGRPFIGCTVGEALKIMTDEQPTIQPKRGKWIKTARWGRVYYCDQCRNYLDFDGVNAGRGSTNFCPNCGAKMEVTE